MQKVQVFIKNKSALMAILTVAVLGMALAGSTNVAKSDNCPQLAPTHPQFDVWPLSYNPSQTCVDLSQIDGFNVGASGRDGRFAQSQAEHDAGVHANAGDTVFVSIYFHNGASDQVSRTLTTAHNVVISSTVNAGSATDHTFDSSISASNAATVSDASRGGPFVVHTGSPTTVSMVPGSAGLCITVQGAQARGLDPNTLANCGTADKLVPVPDSIFNGSFNMGDLEACFPFSGTLDFKVTFNGVQPQNGQLSITKQVENLTQGGNFSNSTNANQNDTVQYKVVVTDTGSGPVSNVVLNDPGASGLNPTGPNPFPSNKNLGTLNPGQSATTTYQAIVTASSGTVTNTATASGSNVASVSASANVFINQQQNGQLSITKQVENLTQGGNFSNSTNAHQNDTVQYQVVVTNNSNATVNNVVLNDPGTSGITPTGSNPFPSNKNLGSLNPGQSSTTDYSAVVIASSGTVTNTATASGSNVASVSASANVFVNQQQQNGQLSITKQVEDLTQGTGFSSSVTARQNDTVEYRVTVSNVGSGTVNNVNVSDPGASGLGNNGNSFPINQNLGSFNPGQSQTVFYTATVVASSGTITNTATASGSNVGSVSASANVFVNGNNQNGFLSITKQVADQTLGTGFSSSTNARQNDIVTYHVLVTNNSGTTLNNVTVSDPGASGLSQQGQTFFNLGTMFPGNSETVNYSATVLVSSGTIINTATASASNATSASASATVFVNQGNNQNGFLSITKQVRNLSFQNVLQKNITAFQNDQVGFQIQVTNNSGTTLNNVRLTDTLPAGFNYAFGTTQLDGNSTSDISNNQIFLGQMFAGQTHTVTFRGTVVAGVGTNITNTAFATADNAPQVSDSASITVNTQNTNISLIQSKRAFNNTRSVDATTVPARANDQITYTLTVQNNGSTAAINYIFTDDLSNVLNLSSMVNTFGGTMTGNTISWPAVTIPAGGQATETFEVQVSANLPSSGTLSLINTFGNTVIIPIQTVLGATFVAPKTGASAEVALSFGALVTVAFAIGRKKGWFAALRRMLPIGK